MPAFSYEEDEGSELHHVNFHKYRISSLDVQLCLTSSRTWTSCTFLDGKNFITQLTLNFSLSELPDSVVSKLFPINWDGILWASLDLEVELVNGSVLHVTSPRVQIRVQLICPSNTGNILICLFVRLLLLLLFFTNWCVRDTFCVWVSY